MSTPLYICGPTASGKSSLALAVAEACSGEIVNADAFQLYRDLATVTAAPSPGDMARAPHHLYGVIDPAEPVDAARFRDLACPVLDDIARRGKQAIIVGGSGLYLKFLSHGPSPLPPGDPAVRAELEGLAPEELFRRLAAIDPAEAARIDRHNPRYLQRALEICLLTGRPVSEQRQSFTRTPPGLRGVVLRWDPPALEARIRARTQAMLAGGAVEEVASLPTAATTAAKAIGVAEIRAQLAGEIDLPECEDRIVIATRRYAKRQRTWFRRETWLTPVAGDAGTDELVEAVRAAAPRG